MFEAFRSYARAGAAELFGFDEELGALREAAADARLLARKVEDFAFGDLFGQTGSGAFTVERTQHREMVRRAYEFYFGDGVVRRVIDLRTFYVFGTGVPRPRYRNEPGEDDDGDVERGQEVIDRLWADSENRRTLTGTQAQFEKSLELQAQGNVFLVLFPAENPVHIRAGEEGPTNLKIADLPESEVTQIITHPRNRKVPLYYQRDFTTVRWDPGTGMYAPGAPKTLFYRDWKHDAPPDGEVIDGQEWHNPPREQIAVGRVYHIKVNSTSDMRFGVSEVHSILQWAKGLNDFMTSRMATAQALAQMAMQYKVHGGARSVSQGQAQLQSLQGAAAKIDSGEGLSRERTTDQRTKVPVSNQSAQLAPAVQDTGAATAGDTVAIIKGQVAAGSGIPVQHLGGNADAPLTSALSIDGPSQKMHRATQELWRGAFTEITAHALKLEGLDPDRLEVMMPPITDRDAGQLAEMLSGLIQVIWPNGGVDRTMIRFVFGEVLDAMGKANADRILNELFPEGWEAPEPVAPATAATPGAPAGAARVRAANERAGVQRRQRSRKTPDERGGPVRSGATSVRQSQQRAARVLEALPVDLVEAAEQALGEVDALVEDPGLAVR